MVTKIRLNSNSEIHCSVQNTSNGFRHYVKFMLNGREINSRSVNYLNRAWESYKFESAIKRLLEKMIKQKQINNSQAKEFLEISEDHILGGFKRNLKTLSTTSKMVDVLQGDIKKRNESKLRMIKATFGHDLILPENWNRLSEKEKEIRLNIILKDR
jgi:hypothetical protein